MDLPTDYLLCLATNYMQFHMRIQELTNQILLPYAYDDVSTKLTDLTNEKMFELTGLSDTVMRELKKEEEEIVLLHQAVKDEHASLKNTVTAAGKAAKTMRESIEKIHALRPVEVSYGAGSVKIAPMASKENEKK